jgi:hypothetical protein
MKRKQKIKALYIVPFFFVVIVFFVPDSQDLKGNFDLVSFLTKVLLFTIGGVVLFWIIRDSKKGL